jgi:hypothetical protein
MDSDIDVAVVIEHLTLEGSVEEARRQFGHELP